MKRDGGYINMQKVHERNKLHVCCEAHQTCWRSLEVALVTTDGQTHHNIEVGSDQIFPDMHF